MSACDVSTCSQMATYRVVLLPGSDLRAPETRLLCDIHEQQHAEVFGRRHQSTKIGRGPVLREVPPPGEEKPSTIRLLHPRDLRLSPFRCRVENDPRVIDEYAEAMLDGDLFPPLLGFRVEGHVEIVDGWLRVLAARQASIETLEVDVKLSTVRMAIASAAGANYAHGLRRTRRDKRASVTLLLDSVEFAKASQREIARLARVSHTFVNNILNERAAIASPSPEPSTSKSRVPMKQFVLENSSKIETGARKSAPDNVCLLLGEHTLCGEAFDLYAKDLIVYHEAPQPVSCPRCREIILLCQRVELAEEPSRGSPSQDDECPNYGCERGWDRVSETACSDPNCPHQK